MHPELAREWHPTRNGEITPAQVYAGSSRRAWWRCDAGHEWEATIQNRSVNGTGCKRCMRLRTPPAGRSLAALFPLIASEWHPTLNRPMTADDVPAGRQTKVWWRCPAGHDYEASPSSRTNMSSGCPYCAGKRAGYGNTLADTDAHLAAEWDDELNAPLTASQVTRGSAKRVHWVCRTGHRWQATVNSRTNMQSGCPHCSLRQTSSVEIALRNELRSFFADIPPAASAIDASGAGLVDRRRWPKVDVLIPTRRIIVEYDGSWFHQARTHEDSAKSALLRRLGYRVVRVRPRPLQLISGDDVAIDEPTGDLDGPVAAIAAAVLRRVEDLTGESIVGLDDYESAGLCRRAAETDRQLDALRDAAAREIDRHLDVGDVPPVEEWAPSHIPAVLTDARAASGMSTAQLAERYGWRAEQYRRWEAGAVRPRHSTYMAALALFLGVDEADVHRLCGRRPPVEPRNTGPGVPAVPEWPAMGFAPILAALRQQAGLSQRQLGDALGVSNSAVSAWERGKGSPRRSLVPSLAVQLGCDGDALAALLSEPSTAQVGKSVGRSFPVGTLARMLADRRRELDMSQAALASMIPGATQSAVAGWECGKTAPRVSQLADLAEALGRDVSDIVAAHPGLAERPPFGQMVITYRARHRLDQHGAANALGVSQGVISKWERGDGGPWPRNYAEVAATLSVSVEEVAAAVASQTDRVREQRTT